MTKCNVVRPFSKHPLSIIEIVSNSSLNFFSGSPVMLQKGEGRVERVPFMQ